MEETLSKIEDITDEIIRRTRDYIAPIGRILILLTFFDDSYRLIVNFAEHTNFENSIFVGLFSILIRLYCIFTQIISPCLIIRRKWIDWSCISLLVVVVVEIFDWETLRNHRIIVRTIGVLGGLLLLMGEGNIGKEQSENKPDLPRMDNDNMELGALLALGRVYCIFMSASICRIHLYFSIKMMSQLLITLVLIFPLVIGYKTRKAAFILVVWFTFLYIANNTFWWELDYTGKDFRKYDFFQTISTIGSLLILIHAGPGDISIDTYKKKW